MRCGEMRCVRLTVDDVIEFCIEMAVVGPPRMHEALRDPRICEEGGVRGEMSLL